MGITQSNDVTFTLDTQFPLGLFTSIRAPTFNSDDKTVGRELDAITDVNNTLNFSFDNDDFKTYYFNRPRYYDLQGNVINIYYSDEKTQAKTDKNKLAFISINQGQFDFNIELKPDNYILKYGRSNYNTNFSNNITSIPVYNIKDGEVGKSVIIIGGIIPEIKQVKSERTDQYIDYSGNSYKVSNEPSSRNGLTLDFTLTSRFAVNLENDGYVLKVQLWMKDPPFVLPNYYLIKNMDIDIPLPKYLGNTLIGFKNNIKYRWDQRYILTLSVYNKNGSTESSIGIVASVDATLYFN